MRSAALPRPQLQFALLAALVVAAESLALASRKFALHPDGVRAAVIFDLAVVPALLWWLLVVRRGLARPRSIATVTVLGVALSAALFGSELRLLAAPLEIALVVLLAREIRTSQSLAARAIRSEFAVFWYALFSWGRTPPEGFTAYKRAGWTAIYAALLIVVVAEGVPLHFVLSRGWGLLSAALHVYTALWLLGDLRALKLRPLRVENGVLLLRIGLRWQADIPLAAIASVARGPAASGLKLGVLGSPNLVLKLRAPATLDGPYGIRRTADTLLLQVDDPDGLATAISGSAPPR